MLVKPTTCGWPQLENILTTMDVGDAAAAVDSVDSERVGPVDGSELDAASATGAGNEEDDTVVSVEADVGTELAPKPTLRGARRLLGRVTGTGAAGVG